MLTLNEKTALVELLETIEKSLVQARSALARQNMTIFWNNLKALHNTTTKVKNEVVDIALDHLDSEAEQQGKSPAAGIPAVTKRKKA